MQVTSMHFKARSGQKLADVRLQQNLKILSQRWTVGRTNAIAELDDFEGTRDEAVERRNRTLANLDVWLERFEQEATARGATVLWAETPEDASRLVVEIARRHEVAKVTKSKSMVSEEMALNRHLEAAGVKVVETDPGLKGNTASGGSKPAKLETGVTIQVPLFISIGEVVKVDTRSGDYIERVS